MPLVVHLIMRIFPYLDPAKIFRVDIINKTWHALSKLFALRCILGKQYSFFSWPWDSNGWSKTFAKCTCPHVVWRVDQEVQIKHICTNTILCCHCFMQPTKDIRLLKGWCLQSHYPFSTKAASKAHCLASPSPSRNTVFPCPLPECALELPV